MRLVIDLQAAQTPQSHNRGVGRYTMNLATAIAEGHRLGDVHFIANGSFENEYGAIKDALDGKLPPHRISAYRYPAFRQGVWSKKDPERQVASEVILQHAMRLSPDILHISHLFEDFIGPAAIPNRLPETRCIVSATVYDLIPLIFKDVYLTEPSRAAWYFERLALLSRLDLLLAISESTRQDVIDILGISPDRVVNISGACDKRFRPLSLTELERDRVLRRCGISKHFLLYTGGDDHRKNLDVAVEGFAEVPVDLRGDYQLVIACHMRPERAAELRSKAQKAGLPPNDLVFPGYVSDDDLVALYNLCGLFLFPSLYEGFGLPVLEAMSCGAPVLAGNNSSVREVIDCPDAMFDARSSTSLAAAIAKAIKDEGWRDFLGKYGRSRSSEFSWHRSATRAVDAFSEAVARKSPRPTAQLAAWLPRKRLAYFTPLPPARSGIADYNAAFLPYLSRYFDIEIFIDDQEKPTGPIAAMFPIRSSKDFPRLRDHFYAVMYEFGNSEFHVHMQEMLERFPGIVGLHDAYLSGMLAYITFTKDPSFIYREALASHGTKARRYLAPCRGESDGLGELIRELPITKGVMDKAIGLISHAPFNREVSKKHYPYGWRAPFRIIKQIVRLAKVNSQERRRAKKAELGFDPDDFVVATFGHIAWTKLGDRLLEAFVRSTLALDPNTKLVFAGELASDAFGANLKDAISRSRYADKIRITGFLAEKKFSDYLAATDVAFQLRQFSRGGTPKGVLDCLANGVPTVVNDYASYQDYPSDVVHKIPEQPTVDDVVQALERIFDDAAYRAQLMEAGRNYVAQEHAPEAIAAEYACAIHELVSGWEAGRLPTALANIAENVLGVPLDDDYIQGVAAALTEAPQNFRPIRIVIDVTSTARHDHRSGIQRVVRNIVRELYCSNRSGIDVQAVAFSGDGVLVPNSFLKSLGVLLPHEIAGQNKAAAIEWGPRDVLLMLDPCPGEIESLAPALTEARQKGAKVYTVIYDLLPLRMPQHFVEGGKEWFRRWVDKSIEVSDGVLCISRTVADDVQSYIKEQKLPIGANFKIGWFHLGANFEEEAPREPTASPRISDIAKDPVFLMVGVIEPRKGHELVLDAFELLWAKGVDFTLCFAGRHGWMCENLIQRVRAHAKLNAQLFFFEELQDHELAALYRKSSAVLVASTGEGFGLPIVEAARQGVAVIASDLPVFREVGGSHIEYFRERSPEAIAEALEAWNNKYIQGTLPDIREAPVRSWEQSSQMLLDVVIDNAWYNALSTSKH